MIRTLQDKISLVSSPRTRKRWMGEAKGRVWKRGKVGKGGGGREWLGSYSLQKVGTQSAARRGALCATV